MSTLENEKLEAKNLENENLEVIAPEAHNSTEETVFILTEEQELLFQWGCEELFLDFGQKGINLECFKEMTENDINNLIPEERYGLRIKFSTRLLEWRKANGLPLAALADTLTMNSSVMSWIKHSNFSVYNSPTSSGSSAPSFLPCQIGMKDGADENSCSDIINKNLEEILKDSFIGKKILEIFEKKQPLSFKTRDELCDIIAHYWIINNYEHVLSSQYCRQILADIVKMFPKEDQEYYISSNKKIKGKLAQKYYSLSRKYREKGIIESRYKIKKQKTTIAPSTSNTSECNEEPYEIDEGMIGNQLWLKSNKQPEALVVDKWRSTFILRRKHLKEDKDIFFEWPILKQQIGVSLIELDFDELYPGKSQLLSKWDNFKQKITEVYKKNIKDSASKKYFDLLSQEVSADSENYLFCILLTSILVPSGIHSTKEGAKYFWKPSILQAQSFMALHIETENNIHNVVEKHRENLLNRGLTNQPLIIIIGRDSSKSDSRCESQINNLDDENRRSRSLDADTILAQVAQSKSKTPWKKVKNIIQTHKGSFKKGRSRSIKSNTSEKESRDVSPCDSIERFDSSEQTSPTQKSQSFKIQNNTNKSQQNSPISESEPSLVQYSGECFGESKLLKSPNKLIRKSKILSDFESLPEDTIVETKSNNKKSLNRPPPSPLNLSVRLDSSDAEFCDTSYSPTILLKSPNKLLRYTKALASGNSSVPSSPSRHSEFFGEFESEDLSSGDFSEPSTPHRKLSQKSSFEAQKEEINERYMELKEKLNQEFEAKRQEWEKIRSVCCTSTSCAYQLISKDESSIQSNKNIPSKMLEENLSADFKKKLHKWRVKKQISSASIKGDMNSPTKECETKKIDWNLWKSGQLKLDGQGLTPLPDQKNLPEDFQKKLEQWKKMKDTNTVPSYQGNNDSLRRSSGKFGMGIKMTDNSKKSKQEDDKTDRDKHQRPERDKNKSNDKDKLEKLSKLKAIVTDPRAKEIEVQTSIGVMKFEGISRKFTRKLYEWEKARGIGPESSTFALLHPGYRPLDVGKITKEKRSHENSPNLGRSLSLDSISPNPSMLSISHQTSSLSLNDVTDLKEGGSLKDRKIVSNPEIEDKDLQDEPEAVIVEVEDDIIETAAPLVSVLPMAEHQTPIYRYEEIACKDFRSARKLEQIENNSKICVETMENVNRVTLYLDEHKNDYTENILHVMGILNSLNKSIPNLEKYTTQRNPTTRNAMEIVKKLVTELIGQLTELNEDEACCQETINERTNLIALNLRNLQKSINLICQYVKTSEKNIPKINITADDCIDRSIATVSITPTIFQSEIIINQPKVLIAGFSNTINNTTVVDSSELSYNNASQSQPEFSETSSGKKVHRNVSNGSKKKTRLRRIGSRQNSKTESDSSDDDATNNVVLETQRRLKRKSSRNKKSTEDEKHENENHDNDGFNGDDIVYVLKIKPGQPIKQEEIYNEQNNELNNVLISPTETSIQLLNVSEENLTSTSANIFVKTKRKLFTTVSESTISSSDMTFSIKDVESSSDRTSSERTEKKNSSRDNISLTSLPPIPQSPNYSRRNNECKNLPKEPSPSIRMMIAKYNQKLESDKSPTSSGTCTPSSMRSPVLERRNVIEQSNKYEQNIDKVKKSASAGNISNNSSNNNMNLPIMEYTFGKEKRKLKRLSKSFSADLLPQKNDVINNKYLSKNQYIQSLACDSLKIINKTSGIISKNILISDKKEHIYRKHKEKPTSLVVGKLGALKKIDAKNKNDNIWRRSISSGDTEIENYPLQPNRSDNTIPKITRKLEAKATTPTEKSHPNSSDLWHPIVSLPLKKLYDFDRPKTPLTERALKLQRAKEEFLRRTPSKSPSTGDNDSNQDFNWTHHRLSQVSVGSETSNENNCSLLKSASVGMIAEDNDNNSENIVGYESLPRNVSRSGKITSKLGFATLASKFSKVKIRNNNNKDQKLPTPKINVVSALCRQSLLLDLNTQSQEICSKNLTKSKSLQISGFGTIFKPKYKDKLNKSKSAHIVPNDKK